MMLTQALICLGIMSIGKGMQFSNNPTSEMSADEKGLAFNKTEQSDESGYEVEGDVEDKKYLDEAMKTVLDPNTVILKGDEVVENFKSQIDNLEHGNASMETFMTEMDKLSLEICKTSQESLWDYVTDINSETKKTRMVRIAAEEDEIKKQYWTILKTKYLNSAHTSDDAQLARKVRIIRDRGTNVLMPQSKQREEIDTMQRTWSRVAVCAYNISICNADDSMRTMSDIITIFKTSNDTKELSYYWRAYRDATGKKIRPIFKDYVFRMNKVAISEDFNDAGDMWRYAFDDSTLKFKQTVERLWNEIKPIYNLLHSFVRKRMEIYYEELKGDNNLIPAHILGNLWAQEWQAIYPKVAPYPNIERPTVVSNETVNARDLFHAVDEFHQSLGFESAQDTFQDIKESMSTVNCLPSSHDMCDGIHYKIKWCGEKISDVTIGLSRAARLLGHVQYFKHYRNLEPLYRDGPNPAFHDAVSDIVAVQIASPNHLSTLNFVKVDTTDNSTINHLLWLALEKFPLMAYAYVLDKWRWDVFSNSSMENLNQHWWDLRVKETGISAPVLRNESDLDPAAKYHVVSHVQYITYLISHILEFQILSSLCKKANHTGPLHECSIYGVKEAGKLLSDGMSLGASKDWSIVLKTMTGETELSTSGILDYFMPLKEFLNEEIKKLERRNHEVDSNAPFVVGIIVVILIIFMFVLYCFKKRDKVRQLLSLCGLSKNGSLDIATQEIPRRKPDAVVEREEKV
ncbi:angiotensin-converting enzyme-like isoform X1 [Danaus plexippus]|uniref:angiotensin-converting enzyme-like isoform X1 n=1 Tax=Danaus plexippus TaxID=13037 RepID=UPI002AB0D7E7|nr:angiotensin-converting enzyme-like isoform X1 [Danaus plexippus]